MKNLLSNLITVVSIILVFSSCEKDLYESGINNDAKRITVKSINLNTYSKKPQEIISFQRKMQKKRLKSAVNRMVYDSVNDFYIDEENVKYIQSDDNESYTISLKRETVENVENLVFDKQQNGDYNIYLVKYDFTPEELKSMSEEQLSQQEATYVAVDFDENGLMTERASYFICVYVWETAMVPINQGDLTGEFGYQEVQVLVSSFCEPIGAGVPGSNNPGNPGNPANNTGNPGSGYGSGGSGSGSNNSNTTGGLYGSGSTYTIPVIPLKTPKQIKLAFQATLNATQLGWWNATTNSTLVSDLVAYLTNNQIHGVEIQPEMYVVQMINSAVSNPDGYMGDGFLGDEDDNGIYLGPKSYIPNPIVLSDGSTVSVTFGSTSSDGQSANQEVADDVIAALKSALEVANQHLGSSNKITSIYIKASTNGSHSATSNHSKGTALDISRINGAMIINSGNNSQVQALQNGFDSYQNIRENFGPHFKHKTYADGTRDNNYNVGGHKDHIHISVQNN